jgi:hypothetical protein
MQTQTNRPAELAPATDLAAMERASDTCRRVQKLRTLAALRLENARIRLANLQRDGGAK